MQIGNVCFDATEAEYATIDKIVERARQAGVDRDPTETTMDLSATHSNGCPLDFDKLLAADDFTFLHDILGIARHLDRTTGKLGQCFVPRCAKPQPGH